MTPTSAKKERRIRDGALRLLLRDRDVAVAVAMSVSWVRQRRAADTQALRAGREPGGPKWITIGKSVFYRLADLEAWITANAQEHGLVAFANRGHEDVTT